MSNKTIQIVSKHATVAAAVEAAQLDLSYNEREAKSNIKAIDCPPPRFANDGKVSEAFVVNIDGQNEVLYIFNCDIRILNKFNPFYSILDDTKFRPVVIRETEIEILDLPLGRDKECRKLIRKGDLIVTTI